MSELTDKLQSLTTEIRAMEFELKYLREMVATGEYQTVTLSDGSRILLDKQGYYIGLKNGPKASY